MNKQYCKVGSITPIATNNNAITLLEYQYQNFLNKASTKKYTDSNLVAFFELKALKIQKHLESLIKHSA